MQVCDVVYAHLLDELRREVDHNRLVAVMVAANGGEPGEPQTFAEAQERLDAMLAAPPPTLSGQDEWAADLRSALGLPGRR